MGEIPGISHGHEFFSLAKMVVIGFHSHWLNGIDYIRQAYQRELWLRLEELHQEEVQQLLRACTREELQVVEPQEGLLEPCFSSTQTMHMGSRSPLTLFLS